MNEKNNQSNKNGKQESTVHIEQINPRTELNDLEKTAILQFKLEQKEEELSKTTQFKMLNSKNTVEQDLDFPKSKKNNTSFDLPKKKVSLGDTIKLKISDLRAAIEEKNIELPTLKQKKSLYDTVIIKLDNIINNNSSLKKYRSCKVTNIENTKECKKKLTFIKPKDITKTKNFKLNVDSEAFGSQLYNLNKFALSRLSNEKSKHVRTYNGEAKRLENIEKITISKDNYLQYQKKLNEFAINKLYYKLAPKETKRYQVYKYSIILSCLLIIVTSLFIARWFFQGRSIHSLSDEIAEKTTIDLVQDGELFNIEEPKGEEVIDQTGTGGNSSVGSSSNNKNKKKSMYWKYLNTPLSSVDFTSLKKQNKDTVGWIIVKNTNVNYPVVQTTNNDYYLKHAFDKSKNSAGWVYADFRNDFYDFNKNTVIYAHGRKDKVMFGSLTNTLDSKWYKNEDNQIIQFSTLKYNTMWQIISIYKIRAESYYITTDFSSDESFLSFAQNMKDRSIYDFGINVTKEDKLLTLSTCYNDNGIRLVVQAKLVKIQER